MTDWGRSRSTIRWLSSCFGLVNWRNWRWWCIRGATDCSLFLDCKRLYFQFWGDSSLWIFNHCFQHWVSCGLSQVFYIFCHFLFEFCCLLNFLMGSDIFYSFLLIQNYWRPKSIEFNFILTSSSHCMNLLNIKIEPLFFILLHVQHSHLILGDSVKSFTCSLFNGDCFFRLNYSVSVEYQLKQRYHSVGGEGGK